MRGSRASHAHVFQTRHAAKRSMMLRWHQHPCQHAEPRSTPADMASAVVAAPSPRLPRWLLVTYQDLCQFLITIQIPLLMAFCDICCHLPRVCVTFGNLPFGICAPAPPESLQVALHNLRALPPAPKGGFKSLPQVLSWVAAAATPGADNSSSIALPATKDVGLGLKAVEQLANANANASACSCQGKRPGQP